MSSRTMTTPLPSTADFLIIGGGVVGLTVALETIRGLRRDLPDFERIGGLSNISFGLPLRKLLNRSFLPMALFAGLTAVICDPTDQRLMDTLAGAEAILGLDPGCRSFLELYRSKK